MKTRLSVCVPGAGCTLGVPAFAAGYSDSAGVLSTTPVHQACMDSRTVCRQTQGNATPEDAAGGQSGRAR